MTDAADKAEAPPASDWGAAPQNVAPREPMFWFDVDGKRLSHLDLTGGEVVALEQRLGVEWNDIRPRGSIPHRMAILETFIARSDPEDAAKRVAEMTMADLDKAVTYDDGTDLPTRFEDGLPKAADAP